MGDQWCHHRKMGGSEPSTFVQTPLEISAKLFYV